MLGQRIRISGDPKRLMEAERLTTGIAVAEPILDGLHKLGERFGVAL